MDLRLAVRELRRRPIVSVAVVGAIALSVAVTSSLFSVVDGFMLRPLPFPEGDRLVAIGYRRDGSRPVPLAVYPEFADRREALRAGIEQSPLLEAVAQAGFKVFFDPDAARDLDLEVTGIDARFLPLFGLAPAVGVTFSREDERSPAPQGLGSDVALPVIVSHDLARRLFGSAPGALGVHELAGRMVRVVGVMGPGTKFPGETNVWCLGPGPLCEVFLARVRPPPRGRNGSATRRYVSRAGDQAAQ